jgi:hypothetical protein
MQKADPRSDRCDRIQGPSDFAFAPGDVSRLSAGRKVDENFLQRSLGGIGSRKHPFVLAASSCQLNLVSVASHREQLDGSQLKPLATPEGHILPGAQAAGHSALEKPGKEVVGLARACKNESAHRTEIDTPGSSLNISWSQSIWL